MWNAREIPSAAAWAWGGILAAAVAIPVFTAAPSGGEETAPSPPVAAEASADTRTNLQHAFENEVNVKARYLESAMVADREQYPYVAHLFRACAAAEQVHADRHVTAIAWAGGEAKAFLQKLAMGTTAENLRVAVDLESYEAEQVYPAMLAKAREEHQSHAVRSLNFALAAEREHARLFAAALASLDQRLPARPLHVCSQCGKTVEAVDFKKCPNCFNSARKFQRVD